MILKIDQGVMDSLSSFSLPSFTEIPDVGLYLNQCATYINRAFGPLEGISITESMISNYVKKKLIPNPQKKQYSRESIAYLMFISVAKTVVSLDDIQTLISLQKRSFKAEESYEYFKKEFEAILGYVFGINSSLEEINQTACLEKELLRNILVTVFHKTYIDLAFSLLRSEKNDKKES